MPSPSATAHTWHRLLQRGERALASQGMRLLLSFLIILSVLPATALTQWLPESSLDLLDPVFLALFAPEFALRLALWWRRGRERRAWESLLLVTDLLALVSFLPLRGILPEHFRLLRVTRLLLLLGYWGGMLRDLWSILSGRERRFQVVFVFMLGLVLSFVGAVVLMEFAPRYDYDGNGSIGAEDRSFPLVLWWSFRQVQNSGNLVTRPSDLLVVVVSLGLTFVGVVLFSFIVGISTGAMDELMRRQQGRPVGLRAHTVVLGVGPYTQILFDELAHIYRKNGKQARVAVLGAAESPPDCLYEPALASFRYRQGSVDVADHLDRVDAESAKRVLVLGTGSEDPDARVISAMLAARARSSKADLYPDLEHEKNFLAARTAGGPRTLLVGSGPFLGYYVAQNVVYPGVYRAYRQLLRAQGCEIYTYLFSDAERRRLPALELEPLYRYAYREHGVTLMGVFVSPPERGDAFDHDVVLNPGCAASRERAAYAFEPSGVPRAGAVRGLIGLCERWSMLKGLAERLGAIPPFAASPPALADMALEPSASEASRVLICGSSLRVPRVICELALVYGHLDVTVLVRDRSHLLPLAHDVEAALDGYLSGLPRASGASAWNVESSDDGVDMRARAAGGDVRVRVLHSDWSDATRLLRDPAVGLAGLDVLLFLPRETSEETDGMVALDCLRMAHFEASGAVRFRPGFRVLGMMRDPVKSDLLERRLDEMAGPGESRFSIISSERIRHHFMVQNLFVRGLNAVLLDVLGAAGQHLCRLLPRTSAGAPLDGDFDPWELALTLRSRSQVLLGLELVREGGRVEVIFDPRELAAGTRIAWSEVGAVYLLREGQPGRGPA